MCRFSIVIPYYNRERYLERCIRSVAAQSIRPLQIVLVDNNSTDNSAALCAHLVQQLAHDSHLDFILTAADRRGAAAARNQGVSVSTGEWVCFFDSDDEMSPHFLSDADKLITQGHYTMLAGATQMVFADGTTKRRAFYRSNDAADQILCSMLATQGMIFRREWLGKLGGWDESLLFWDDFELGVRALLQHPSVGWLPSKAYHRIFQHPQSITGPSLSHNFSRIATSLQAVQKDIQGAAPRERNHLLAAFDARVAVIATQFRNEQRTDLSNRMRTIFPITSPSLRIRIALPLIQLYGNIVGKGTWWIARLLLKMLWL